MSASHGAIRITAVPREVLADEDATQAHSAGHAQVGADDSAEQPTCEDGPWVTDRLERNARREQKTQECRRQRWA